MKACYRIMKKMFIDILLKLITVVYLHFYFHLNLSYLHECLGYLLENKKIDDECFNKFIFSFKNNSRSNYIWHH